MFVGQDATGRKSFGRDREKQLPAHQMMKAFGIPPSRRIGDLKKALEECVEKGEVASHQPAEAYIAFLRENAARFGL